jgi:hypothetical protein
MDKRVIYTAVMLDEKTREVLKQEFGHLVPDGWEWIAHHMTITLGELPEISKKMMLGEQVNLAVESLGFNDKVIAIGVDGYYSKNKKPHITLAVNRANGGKPVMSNQIEDWKPHTINKLLTGTVEEYTN